MKQLKDFEGENWQEVASNAYEFIVQQNKTYSPSISYCLKLSRWLKNYETQMFGARVYQYNPLTCE